MEENITKGLFNLDSLNEASKGTVRAIDYYLIKENELNDVYSQDDIDCLKDNIMEFQLSQPIIVRKNKNNSYTIISGHRRFKACVEIFKEGNKLMYFDKEYVNQIPCIIINKEYENADDEFLAIVSSNAARVLTAEERKNIYIKLKEIYDRKCKLGKKPPGRERETIASWMGISQRTIGNYKKELKNENIQKQNNKGRYIKKLSSLEYRFIDFDPNQYSEEELIELKSVAIPAINIVMQRLDIDLSEL